VLVLVLVLVCIDIDDQSVPRVIHHRSAAETETGATQPNKRRFPVLCCSARKGGGTSQIRMLVLVLAKPGTGTSQLQMQLSNWLIRDTVLTNFNQLPNRTIYSAPCRL
jgi:hypothetical protein